MENENIFSNNEWMQEMAGRMFAQELDKLSEDLKAALEKTRVDLVRHPDRIEVVIDPRGDPDVEKIRDAMLDSLVAPISQVITLFGCQANVKQSS